MINPQNQRCLQILVTNHCEKRCADCSEMIGLIPDDKRFHISLENFERALQSVEGHPGTVGIFGGNPLLHPEFDKLCELLRKYVFVKAKREVWCSKANWDKWQKVIEETFYSELVTFNSHENEYECYHQPVHIAADEVFDGSVTGNPGADLQLMWKLISNCWVQQRWSSIISPLGIYPCEVMAARAVVLGGPAGVAVEKGWWKLPIESWAYQIQQLCPKCSMCLPVPQKIRDNQEFDTISPCLFWLFGKVGAPGIEKSRFRLADVKGLQEYYKGHRFEPFTEWRRRGHYKDFPDWRPNSYRPVIQNAPDKIICREKDVKAVIFDEFAKEESGFEKLAKALYPTEIVKKNEII